MENVLANEILDIIDKTIEGEGIGVALAQHVTAEGKVGMA